MADILPSMPDTTLAPLGEYPRIPQSDHDAIITLVSETRQTRRELQDIKNIDLKDIRNDIKAVNENLANRVERLEEDKLSKGEATAILNDHESRIRTQESWRWKVIGIVIGAVAVLNIVTVLITFYLTANH